MVIKKNKFTLVELMFVVAVLVILIGISWVAGAKVLRNQTVSKTKAEIKIIRSAIMQYSERHNNSIPPYSDGYSGPFDIAEWLSAVSPQATWKDAEQINHIPRKMFIEAHRHNIKVTVPDYDWTIPSGKTISNCKIQDPYEQDYIYRRTGNTFKIISPGLDGIIDTEDDVIGE